MASAGPLRGRKESTYEGGMRVPALAWWPGQIKAGTASDALLTAMDILLTFAGLAGARISQDRKIDGKNIWPVLSSQAHAKSPHDRFFYFHANELKAVRSGPWKYYRILPPSRTNSTSALFNLKLDIGETKDLSEDHPEMVAKLLDYITQFEEELANVETLGPGVRKVWMGRKSGAA